MAKKSPIAPEIEDFGPGINELLETAAEPAPRRRVPTPDTEGPRMRRRRPEPEEEPRPRNNSRRQKQQERPERPAHRKKVVSGPNPIMAFFRDQRLHIFAGIILCAAAVISVAMCISYLFAAEADQSVVLGRSAAEIVAAGDVVVNAGNSIGAKVAQWMMVNFMGVSSFIIAFWVFVLGLACMKLARPSFWSFSFRCLFSAASLSIIIGYLTLNRPSVFPLGGVYGQYWAALVEVYAGALGAYALCILLAALLITVFLNPVKKAVGYLISLLPKPTPAAERKPAEEEHEPAEHEPAFNDLPSMEYIPAADDEEPEMVTEEADSPAEAVREPERVSIDLTDLPVAEPETQVDNTEEQKEPEMIFVQPSEAEAEEVAQEPQAVQHGDHIGLDVPFDPTLSHSNYVFPSTELLLERNNNTEINPEEQAANKQMIINSLRSFDVEIQRIEATIGPTVTLYEIVPAEGTRISKIKSLEDDLAMSLSAEGIRIIAPMPGRGTIGIEVPNRRRQIVSMRSVLESKAFRNTKMRLPMALGHTISNEVYIEDLAKLPHLLVAGATGQGKSVGLNCIITSLIYARHPDELKFVLIDPKTVEFSLYRPITNAYMAQIPGEEKAIITDPSKVIATLNSLCIEMDRRYELLSDAAVRDIASYNERFKARRLNPENGHRFLPYIVVIVDEFADLMATVGKELSLPISRIAAKARAVGIHMILATQRPSTDIINGSIKNNFPARIAFRVLSSIDSKTILDRVGAQRLIGMGDMLTFINGAVKRVQCAFVDTEEIEAICEHISSQEGFVMPYELPEPVDENSIGDSSSFSGGSGQDEFMRCALYIASQNVASITQMQRKFEIGFNKAGRYMDRMEEMGIVGPANGAKPREVRMGPEEVMRLFQ